MALWPDTFLGSAAAAGALLLLRGGKQRPSSANTDQSTFGYAPDPPPEGLYLDPSAPNQAALCEADWPEQDQIPGDWAARYAEHGYILLRGLLSPQEVASALAAVDSICREEVPEFNQEVQETQRRLGRGELNGADGRCEAILQFEPAANGVPKGKRANMVRKLANYHKYDQFPELALQRHPRVAGVTKALLGLEMEEEIEVFQSIALLKPPRVGREKPWHQDHSYFNLPVQPAASGAPSRVVGLWVALDAATRRNGCMHVLPGYHQEPIEHFQVRDWQICDSTTLEAAEQIAAVEMAPGDALFFSSLLPHGTAPNLSDDKRRAVQFHFAPHGSRRTEDAVRLGLFGGEGKGAMC